MFTQYKLPFAHDALEPVIDTLTMETHHGKHHAAYTATLNTLAEKAGVQTMEITELLAGLDQISDLTLRTGIRNNGGGYYNHNLYFSTISPDGGGEPQGALGKKITETFGSFENFREQISALALTQFGSGWAWLSVTPSGDLVLSNSANQDNPISLGTGNIPIFTIDVWEHAYYLKYRNLRPSYVKAFFDVINWEAMEENYLRALT
ncbi:MAG: superoxide dismutase [Eubacterium sp.]|nr:superoxide dismutase [Eubacterium sp.]